MKGPTDLPALIWPPLMSPSPLAQPRIERDPGRDSEFQASWLGVLGDLCIPRCPTRLALHPELCFPGWARFWCSADFGATEHLAVVREHGGPVRDSAMGRVHIHRKAGSCYTSSVLVSCAHLALSEWRSVCLGHLSSTSTYPWRNGQAQAFLCPTLRDSWEPGVKRGRDWPWTNDGYRVQGAELPSSPRHALTLP